MSRVCGPFYHLGAVLVAFSLAGAGQVSAQCQLPPLTASDPAALDEFGAAVAVRGDFAAIGATNDDEGTQEDAGAVYMFRRNGAFWQESARLVADDGAQGDEFGVSVAMDGDVLIVGASRDDVGGAENAGSAYIFTRNDDVWTQTVKLLRPGGGVTGDRFGFSVDVSGDVAIIGAFLDDAAATGGGAAYVFTRQGAEWVHTQTLTASDAAFGDRFGVSVAIDGAAAVIGAYWDDDLGSQSGAAYVFEFEGAEWVETVKLLPNDGAAGDWFGLTVDIDASDIVVGSHLANGFPGTNSGAAYVFHDDGSTWIQNQKLTAIGGDMSDEFGRAVALDGDVILIGAAQFDFPDIDNMGAAFVFRRNGPGWSQQQVLIAADPAAEDQLGLALDVESGWAFVAARTADLPGPLADAGKTQLYWLDADPDCDNNGIADVCDLVAGNGEDCDGNAVPDICEPDCDANGQTDACDLANGADDCDGNGVLDICETDCNANGVNDVCDIMDGTSPDCNGNQVPDACDLAGGGSEDCNANGTPDECEIDCDANGTPDECEIAGGAPDCNLNGILDLCEADCNGNGFPDDCDLASGTSEDCNLNANPDECDVLPGGGSSDCNANAVPDECEEDCNGTGAPDDCDIAGGTSTDCNGNGIPDECEKGGGLDCNLNGIPDECEADCNDNNRPDDCDVAAGTSPDCNSNSLPDECDIAVGVSLDCNLNGVPDECDPDCNANNTPDDCDIASGQSGDCDGNGQPDECEQAGDPDCNNNGVFDACEADCNGNSVPDECDIAVGSSADCNDNAIPDACDITDGTAADCNGNGVPDACDITDAFSQDCNGNGIPDVCDVAGGASDDCNGNEIPDECASLPFLLESAPLSPIGAGVPQSLTVVNPPAAAGAVAVTLQARADLESSVEFLDVSINGVGIGTLFTGPANDCPDVYDEDVATIDPIAYNALINGQDAVITVVASEAVDPNPALCEAVLIVRISYQELFGGDCNLNGIPDDCELLDGVGTDCNENGVPDDCDIAAGVSADIDGNGVPDDCIVPGDADDDGDVDIFDYIKYLICITGPDGELATGCEVFDFDDDNDVDLLDFGGLQRVFGSP